MAEEAPRRVSLNDIVNAPVEPAPTEPTRLQEDPFTGKPDQRLNQHLGWIGKFVGGGPEKAGNIAALVILLALLTLIIAVAMSAQITNDKVASTLSTVQAGCFSLITGALGYLFGSKKD